MSVCGAATGLMFADGMRVFVIISTLWRAGDVNRLIDCIDKALVLSAVRDDAFNGNRCACPFSPDIGGEGVKLEDRMRGRATGTFARPATASFLTSQKSRIDQPCASKRSLVPGKLARAGRFRSLHRNTAAYRPYTSAEIATFDANASRIVYMLGTLP